MTEPLKFKKPFEQYVGRTLVDIEAAHGKIYLVKYLSKKDPSNLDRKGYLGVGYNSEIEIREFWFHDGLYYLKPISYDNKKEVVRAIFNEAE
jgi:hypothetical protein